MDIPTWLASILGSDAFAQLVLQAVSVIAVSVVTWVAYQFRKRILHDISATDYELLRKIAADAVIYAEQKFKDADGPAKLAEAMKAADAMIASYGIQVTVEQLEKIVEAAVYAETIHADPPVVTVTG